MFYVCSNFFHDDAMNNATRLLNIMRTIASTEGNLSDVEDDYMAFVTDLCWHQLLDKVNSKVPPPSDRARSCGSFNNVASFGDYH